jgi:hypothetical protein
MCERKGELICVDKGKIEWEALVHACAKNQGDGGQHVGDGT